MINFNKKLVLGTIFLSLTFTGCNEILDEQPRSIYTADYFSTPDGINQGFTSLYRQMRLLYGNGYFMSNCQNGTDESTWAQSADGNFKELDMSGNGIINSNTFPTSMVWNSVFPYINTANGIIEKGPGFGIAESMISEARFFRGFYYFMLVQTYGGVPLDLGAGELKYNTLPSTNSARNTVPEVYTKTVFADLKKSIENLPSSPRVTGGVTKNAARLMLAKAYLTYGWWLQNPNNIPTYPEATRTDPDGHNAQWYFQQAYDVAMEGINNPGPYALQPTFYDVNVGSNDRNTESMLYADHIQSSTYYNESDPVGFGSGWAPDNFAAWMQTWNYTAIKSSKTTAWVGADVVSSVQREAAQSLGRPWVRMCPTLGVIKNTFADKTNDSRYDGTFVTTYRGNWNKNGTGLTTVPVLYNANNLPVQPGGAILSFLNDDSQLPAYPTGAGQSGVGAGTLAGRADWVIAPNGISRIVYPGLWKIGTYRTDDPNGLGYPNAGLTRPFSVAKFSEFYFIAAEAAVKGASGAMTARSLINVIRARAGKWKFNNAQNAAYVADNSAAMIAATPAVITIDYILAERSREYYGEFYRWYDLVRTQKWGDYAATYQIGGASYGDHDPQTVTRTIQPFHYLRPIPQNQIDAMEVSADIKAKYQNPGYN
ncbi:RagB/SusD family nutrient uptake outer membrane protein [Chryseobacterium sp. PTM-20240506]|uniref:RagB/SusD family nutrient uptake outer membrane protein n=1 Tax=unclassified Chryseobacterium TaxID=2593645 RepID=UPI0015548CA6|nr:MULTISPECIES: RagB/SusD family nutrient uptake outer membrane protein [unclassified Chryseobacterium]MDC8103506.1 RagB/SusD family nutrient uptake outer membrane protein [Chryseobacterium sp. B21-037]MDQ1803112.1 RagB/SusD family nutrient uptake outer membrane protein [Chryseobacterium sp. CKR4-1]